MNRVIEVTENRIVLQRYSPEERAAYIAEHQDEWNETGARIKELRETLRISKKQLAEDAGISTKTLRKLERGQFIERFKAISRSCINALEKIYYKSLPLIETLVE